MRFTLPRKLHGALSATAIALVLTASPTLAQNVFTASNDGFAGAVNTRGAQQGSPIYAGEKAVVSGQGLIAGQSVNLMRGTTVLNDSPIVVDAEGKFTFELTIEDSALTGIHPLVVIAEGPAAAKVVDLKISPKLALSGEDRFDIASEKVTAGLYQVAFSPKSNAVFVASAVGRPPVKESALTKIDPATLQILASVTPEAATPSRPGQEAGVFAVYGLAVDDINDTVWVTNTRQNTIAVYKQADLSLLKQFDVDTVPHSRDIAIDPKSGRAYVSSALSPDIYVFDTAKLEKLEVITLASQVRGETFNTMSLALDPATRKLFTPSLSTSEVAVINLDDHAAKVLEVPGLKGGAGVAYDPTEDLLMVTGQGSDNLMILKGADGTILHDVEVGAGPLNVAFDPKSRLAFVANRASGTVTAVNTAGEIVANIDGGTMPNQVVADSNGVIWAVNKARGAEDPNGDRIWKITPKAE